MQLLTAMVVFGIYFYFIELVIIENIWFKLLIFVLLFLALGYFFKLFEGHFKIFNKRIDNQTSVWIVVALIFIPLFFVF